MFYLIRTCAKGSFPANFDELRTTVPHAQDERHMVLYVRVFFFAPQSEKEHAKRELRALRSPNLVNRIVERF